MELSQSRAEQQEYLRNVGLAKMLEKRAEKKREKGEEFQLKERPPKRPTEDNEDARRKKKKVRSVEGTTDSVAQLDTVLGSIF